MNGLLYPGGGGSYYRLGKDIFDEVVRLNDAGTYLPIYGICLGSQYMLRYASDFYNALQPLYSKKVSLPLDF